MKNNFILMLCGLLLAMGQSVLAQTPDGETPANEGVCDVLQADGTTKGLYGLCVAFCEAQDHVDVSQPITAEELLALSEQAPSGRILQNYNKKKQETDPPMPCIKVEEPCPCFDSTDIDAVAYGVIGVLNCTIFNDFELVPNEFYDGTFFQRNSIDVNNTLASGTITTDAGVLTQCAQVRSGGEDPVTLIFDITAEENEVCTASLDAKIAELGLNCQVFE